MKTAELLQRKVVDELAFDPKVDSSTVAVTATPAGVVKLEGTVSSYPEKRDAEKAAKRVAGVKAVANDLEVELETVVKRDDTAVAEAALRALKWSASVPADRVTVTVTKGVVKLEGELDWQFQRRAAFDAVKDLLGVKGVLNDITVRARVEPSKVKEKIESAFERSAQIEADHVKVRTEGGTVFLTGTVRSWAEWDEAEDAAWSVPGVTDVRNELEVTELSFV